MVDCREFADRKFQQAKQMEAGLAAGGWNVGDMITDKRDRQASFSCYTGVHAVCELHKLRVALC